jgi:hypothetical protein
MVAKSPKVTRCTRVLQRICYLLRRPECFRPSDRLARWDSHPLDIADFTAYWFVGVPLALTSFEIAMRTNVVVSTRLQPPR